MRHLFNKADVSRSGGHRRSASEYAVAAIPALTTGTGCDARQLGDIVPTPGPAKEVSASVRKHIGDTRQSRDGEGDEGQARWLGRGLRLLVIALEAIARHFGLLP